MIRRVNFFAGPGSGKSTIAARTFSELKIRGHDVEHIPEYVKTWAHEGRKPISYDQLYIFAKQLKSEDVILRNVQTIVSDSPLLMSTAYATMYGSPCARELIGIAQQFDRDFKPLNLYITRTVDYNSKGRYQNYDEAVEFDKFLVEYMREHLEDSFYYVNVEEFDKIIELIEGAMDGNHS